MPCARSTGGSTMRMRVNSRCCDHKVSQCETPRCARRQYFIINNDIAGGKSVDADRIFAGELCSRPCVGDSLTFINTGLSRSLGMKNSDLCCTERLKQVSIDWYCKNGGISPLLLGHKRGFNVTWMIQPFQLLWIRRSSTTKRKPFWENPSLAGNVW